MFAVVRLKGRYNLRHDMDETMNLLHLTRVNHCVVLPNKDTYTGMIKKTKDFITWGEVDETTLATMIKKRGRLPGNKRLDDKWLKEKGYDSWEALAKDVLSGKVTLNSLGLKPLFRLTPPSKGMKSATQNYPKGDLGYRGQEINEYLKRCI